MIFLLPPLLGALLGTWGLARLARRRLSSWPLVLRMVVLVTVGALLFFLLFVGGGYLLVWLSSSDRGWGRGY